jgi:hypothetical protein
MRFFRLIFMLLTALIACACNDVAPEKKTVAPPVKEWRTYAMGRMLVDLPREAVIGEKEEMFGGGVPAVWRKDLTPKSALVEVARREQEHKNFPPAPDRPPSKYISTIDLANGGKGILRWADQMTGETYSQYIANLDCYFITNGQPRVVFYPYQMDDEHLESASQRMVALAPSLYSREENEFPAKPGFCFEGGFVADPYDWYIEVSTLFASLPQYPGLDIVMNFQSAGRAVELGTDDHIRMAKSQRETAKVIRSRKVKLAEGFDEVRELCLRDTKIINDQQEYLCVLSAEGDPKRPDRPNVYITMRTGDFLTPGFPDGPEAFHTDSEALALWDALIERVRPRPTAR